MKYQNCIQRGGSIEVGKKIARFFYQRERCTEPSLSSADYFLANRRGREGSSRKYECVSRIFHRPREPNTDNRSRRDFYWEFPRANGYHSDSHFVVDVTTIEPRSSKTRDLSWSMEAQQTCTNSTIEM